MGKGIDQGSVLFFIERKSGKTDIGLAFLKMDGGSILCYDFSALEDQYFDKIEAVNIMKEETKSKEMDMLNGGLAGKLILFALPLALSSILQQLFNRVKQVPCFNCAEQ